MQTVQFQCGHCGNLMGVSTEFLGEQVRCPTCEQVVVAPASAEPSPSEPSSITESTENLFLANLQSAPIGGAPKPEARPAEPSAPPEPAPVPSPHAVGTSPRDDGAAHEASLPWHDPASAATSSVARAQRQAGGGISWLWLVPLLSYSILVTAVAVYIYFSLQTANGRIIQQNDRIEKLNDEIKDLNEKLKSHNRVP
jgi:hypothetical protein